MTECAARALVIRQETAVLEEQYRFLKVLEPGLSLDIEFLLRLSAG